MDTTEKLLKIASAPLKIRREHLNGHVLHTFESLHQKCFNWNKNLDNLQSGDWLFEIDSILDYLHEELNTGHWSTIPIEIRQNFTIGTFLKALLLLQLPTNENRSDLLKKCLKSVDMGLLLGAPLEETPELLMEAAKCLRVQLNQLEAEHEGDSAELIGKPAKRGSDCDKLVEHFAKLNAIKVEELEVPSVETFNRNFFVPQRPVKIKGSCMSHWPATSKWMDVNYLLKVAGNRTVPVEIGSHYTDENWSQKLMTVREFITTHYLCETDHTGYLAQHNLFDQIGELKEDIRIPEYCCCSLNYEESTDPDINAWLGPKGTVSPLHQDPKNNILAQVYGTKRLLLFSTKDSSNLYPHSEAMLSNTAQIDPLNPDPNKFPDFKRATMYKCLLEPGEMLFIPLKWWHHVTALEKSFSVSFWWQ
ncbi:hypothetical protein YQE_02184, partial [Dendroctonus ponderosae]